MRVTSKGQVTIPIDIREQFGFLPDSEVEFVVEGANVCLVHATTHAAGRGARVVSRLRGTGTGRMTTDQIMRLTRG
jgi:AbrB family looped-hinge helix DNA binding protein